MAFAGGATFRVSKKAEKDHAESYSGNCGLILGEEVYDCRDEQNQENENHAQRDFFAGNPQISRDLPLALFGLGIAQDQHRQRVQGEAPDHAEGVQAG